MSVLVPTRLRKSFTCLCSYLHAFVNRLRVCAYTYVTPHRYTHCITFVCTFFHSLSRCYFSSSLFSLLLVVGLSCANRLLVRASFFLQLTSVALMSTFTNWIFRDFSCIRQLTASFNRLICVWRWHWLGDVESTLVQW
jgi:hypothetical protein